MAQKFTVTWNNNPVDSEKFDKLEEEFLTYQATADKGIQSNVWEEALVRSDKDKSYHHMDVIWAHLSSILPNLSNVALTVLIVPHSNAAENKYSPSSIKIKENFVLELMLLH